MNSGTARISKVGGGAEIGRGEEVVCASSFCTLYNFIQQHNGEGTVPPILPLVMPLVMDKYFHSLPICKPNTTVKSDTINVLITFQISYLTHIPPASTDRTSEYSLASRNIFRYIISVLLSV